MNLLIEYFTSKNPQRDQEYKFCIKQNILNPLIQKIFVFISDESNLDIKDSKIEIVKLNKRPTFYDLFEYANINLVDQICIISNTDIFLDDTLNFLNRFDLSNKFLALTRWDVLFDGSKWTMKFYDNPWWDCYLPDGTISKEESISTSHFSQDSWIFKTPFKVDARLNFLMGRPGCDNRITQIMHENGYDVMNPSKLIITKHFHQTNYRTYTNKDVIPGPYLLVKPTDDLNKKSEIKSIPHF